LLVITARCSQADRSAFPGILTATKAVSAVKSSTGQILTKDRVGDGEWYGIGVAPYIKLKNPTPF
jgi:hypothetical protein